MSSLVKVDGKLVELRYNDFSQEKGHQYLEKGGTYVRHYFKVRVSELPNGFAFKTRGRLYEIVQATKEE